MWRKRFKNPHSFHDVQVSGQTVTADVKAAEEVWETLDQLIVEENYSPEQIFNLDETSLFWERTLKGLFIQKEAKSVPGFGAFTRRKTVLPGGSAAGCKLRPFVI